MSIYVCETGISPYTVFMALAQILSFLTAYLLLRKEGIERMIAGLSVLMNFVLVLFCGKCYTMFFSGGDGMNFYNAPFSSVGGLLGMLMGIEIFNLAYRGKESVFRTVYTMMIPLLYSISKLGCFTVGCCYGIPYDGFGHVHYYAELTDSNSESARMLVSRLPGGNVFPVQLVETIVFAGIFLYSLIRYIKGKRDYLVQMVIILGAIGKFSLEYLRSSNLGRILNPNQIVCLVLLTGSIVWCILKQKKIPVKNEGL